MNDSPNPTPDRPESWSLADEGFDKITRLDYFGQPYQVWQQRKRVDLGQAWKKFKAMRYETEERIQATRDIVQADTDLHDEEQELEADKWNEKIEQYFDNQLNEER